MSFWGLQSGSTAIESFWTYGDVILVFVNVVVDFDYVIVQQLVNDYFFIWINVFKIID
jgi:hypothetical protein